MAFGSKITNINKAGLFKLAKGYNHLRSLTFNSADFDVREGSNGIFVNAREQESGSDFEHAFKITAIGDEDNNQITISGGIWDRTNEDSTDRNWVGLLVGYDPISGDKIISRNFSQTVTATLTEDDTYYVLLELRDDSDALNALNPTYIMANVTSISTPLELYDDARMQIGVVTMANVDGQIVVDEVYQGYVGDVKDNLVRVVDDCSLGMWTDEPTEEEEEAGEVPITYKQIYGWHEATYGEEPQSTDLFLCKRFDEYGASSNCASYATAAQIFDTGIEGSAKLCEKVEECLYGTNTACEWLTGIMGDCDICQWIEDHCDAKFFAHQDLIDVSGGTCADHHSKFFKSDNYTYIGNDANYTRNYMAEGLGDFNGIASVGVHSRQLLANAAAVTLDWGLNQLIGDWSCSGDFEIALNLEVGGNAEIGGDVDITGAANVGGTCKAAGFVVDANTYLTNSGVSWDADNYWTESTFQTSVTGDARVMGNKAILRYGPSAGPEIVVESDNINLYPSSGGVLKIDSIECKSMTGYYVIDSVGAIHSVAFTKGLLTTG